MLLNCFLTITTDRQMINIEGKPSCKRPNPVNVTYWTTESAQRNLWMNKALNISDNK
jgi:hypothetical protein